jgi:hypothetical protein
VYWVVLNVEIMNRAVSKHFTELNEMVRPRSLVRRHRLDV